MEKLMEEKDAKWYITLYLLAAGLEVEGEQISDPH